MYQSQKFKIVLVGDRSVGKRSLLTKAFNAPQRLSPFYIPIECTEIEGKVQDQEVKIHFYDSLIKPNMIAEEDKVFVHEFCAEVIPSAHVILMCFATDDPESLVNLQEWATLVKTHIKPDTFVYLVATKSDTKAHIDSEVYERIKKEIGSIKGRFCTSSVTGDNTQGLFAHILKNLVKLPFKSNETVLESEMASAEQGIATPKRSVTTYDSSSFVMVTPVKRMIIHESTTSIDFAVSRGETAIKTRAPQEVYAARQLDITSDTIRQNRHTRSASSFAQKQAKRSIFDQENKLVQKYVDQDDTVPEDEAEIQMDYLKPGRILSDDMIRFASPYTEKERPSVRNTKDDSIEIQIKDVKEDSVHEEIQMKKEVRPVVMRKIDYEEADSEDSQYYIKVWF